MTLEELADVATDLRRYMACKAIIEDELDVTITIPGNGSIELTAEEVVPLAAQVQQSIVGRLLAAGVKIPGVGT